MTDSFFEPIALANLRVGACKQSFSLGTENRIICLFDQLRGPLLQYLYHFPLCFEDAEEVVQEAFLSLHRQFRLGRPIKEVRGWLFRAAHSLALKKRLERRKFFVACGSETLESEAIDPALNPEELVASQQANRQIQAVVLALNEQDRWCLYLRIQGMRYRQIAEILEISLGSVSNSLQRSLARIGRAAER